MRSGDCGAEGTQGPGGVEARAEGAAGEQRGRIEELLRRNEELEGRVEELTARLEDALAELEEKNGRLVESEERFRLTFEKAKVGMAHVAPDRRWLRVNEKLCQIVGYGREELLGLTFQDITHPEDLDADLQYVRRMLEGKLATYSMEKRYVKKDGSRVWICLSVSLVREPSDDPSYFVSVVEDITERKLKELVPDPLTDLETEVLALILEGQTNRQIAQKLNYSEANVKLQVQHILAKLGVKRRARAARRAVEIGLLPPPQRTVKARSGPERQKKMPNGQETLAVSVFRWGSKADKVFGRGSRTARK